CCLLSRRSPCCSRLCSGTWSRRAPGLSKDDDGTASFIVSTTSSRGAHRTLGAQGACAARASPTRRAAARAWASTLSGSDGVGRRLVEDLIRPAASPLLLLISHASSNGGVRLRARV